MCAIAISQLIASFFSIASHYPRWDWLPIEIDCDWNWLILSQWNCLLIEIDCDWNWLILSQWNCLPIEIDCDWNWLWLKLIAIEIDWYFPSWLPLRRCRRAGRRRAGSRGPLWWPSPAGPCPWRCPGCPSAAPPRTGSGSAPSALSPCHIDIIVL